MPGGAQGNVDIGLDLDTKPAAKALDSFKRKMSNTFGGQDAKQLDATMKQTEKTIKKLETQIDSTKKKIKELTTSDVKPKSVQSMEKELQTAEAQVKKLDDEFKKLSTEQQGLAERQVPGLTLEQSLSPEQFARFKELDALIIKNGEDTMKLESKIASLKAKLAEVEMNPQATDEAKTLNRELDEATKELGKQRQRYSELSQEQANFNAETQATVPGLNTIQNALKRIGTMMKRVFVFGVILKGLRALSKYLTSVMSQNKAFMSSLNQVKGNLLTAFAPIMNTIIPILQTFMNVLARVTAYIAQFMAILTGTSISANKKAAKSYYEQAKAAEAAGAAAGGAGDAAEEAQKQMLDFDELNIIESPDTSGGGGGGGGGGGSVAPFETSDLTLTDEIRKKMEAIMVLVGTIGGALLAWKIGSFITDLITAEEKLKLFSKGFGKLVGITLIVAGAILLIKNYCDAWVTGIDWGNFLGMWAGLLMFITGIALVLSPVAAAFVMVGAGIALVVLGIKDIITNGPTVENILTIISGAALAVLGVLTAMGKLNFFKQTLPILLIIAGVITTIKGVSDAWVNGLDWKNFSLILGGIATVVTTLALAFSPLSGAIALIVGGITMLAVGIQNLVTNGYSMQAVILVCVGAIAVLIGVIWALNAALLANPITWVVVAIMALVAVFVILWNECEGFRNFWIGLWDKVKSAAATVWEKITKVFTKAWEGIKKAWEGCVNFFSAVWEGIKTVFSVVGDVLSGYFKVAWEGIKFVWNTVVSYFKMIWDNIKLVFSVVKDVLSGDFSSAWEGIKEIWNNVTSWFSGVWDGIKQVFSVVDTWFEDIFGDAWTKIKNVFASWGEFFGGLWDTVKQKFTDFGTKMGDAIGDAVKSGINGVLSLIETTINKAINLINGGIDLINLIPGVSVGKVGHITLPRLAQGAVIPPNREFLAVLGDQKHGTNIEAPLDTIVEAVMIALSKTNQGNKNSDININFTGNLSQLARILKPEIQREDKRGSTKLVRGGAY